MKPPPRSPHGEDEFTFAGLTPVASQLVNSPRVAESPVNFECRLSQCIQLTGADGTPIDTGWCSAKSWASISPRVCWKRGFTRPRKRSPFCVRVDRRPTMPSVIAIASTSVRPDARRGNMRATLLPADQQFFCRSVERPRCSTHSSWGESGLLIVARLTLSEA